jgi:hypothetical protein
MKPLVDIPSEKIEFGFLREFDLVRVATPLDGSCMFHAIAKAYFKPYIMGKVGEGVFDRQEFVRNLRKDLALALPAAYSQLANGELEEISKTMPKYSLSSLQQELDSNSPVSNYFNEFISNQLNIDIYVLDAKTKDVYMFAADLKILYKNRKSVVILYLPGHYELIGLLHNSSTVETYFPPTHPLIQKIRERIDSKL